MYGKIVLGTDISATIYSSRISRFKEDNPIDIGLDDDDYYDGDVDLIDDIHGTYYATPSDASASNAVLLTDVQPGSYEWVVIDRLNLLSISAILSTCLLFLILIHRR